MKWTWISHLNELYRFRYTPQPMQWSPHGHQITICMLRWSVQIQIYPHQCNEVHQGHQITILTFRWSVHIQIYPPLSDEVHTDMRYQFICCNCHHFATDCLHDYIQFTIYHLEVHFQCCDAQEISAISPKTCTLKLQLLHNTKRPTKWSGHVKMIDPTKRTSTYKRPFTQEDNYLVLKVKHVFTFAAIPWPLHWRFSWTLVRRWVCMLVISFQIFM